MLIIKRQLEEKIQPLLITRTTRTLSIFLILILPLSLCVCVLYSLNSFLIRLLFSLFFHFNISTFFFTQLPPHQNIFFYLYTIQS